MASSVFFKKQGRDSIVGSVAIRYFANGRKKVISLRCKITEIDFDNYFLPNKNRFRAPYAYINKDIEAKLNDFTIFDNIVKNEKVSLITFFEKKMTLIPNPNTYSGRGAVLNKLKEFMNHKNINDIFFDDIDCDFIVEVKNFIREKNSYSTAKAYMDVLKTVLNLAKQQKLYSESFDYFKGLKYDIVDFKNSALSITSVQLLIDVKKDNKHYPFVQMFLIAIFLQGLRVSDLLLMRNGDFLDDCVLYRTKKTNKQMDPTYEDKLVSLLLRYLGLPTVDKTDFVNVIIDDILENTEKVNNKNKIYGATHRLTRFIQSNNPNDFLFADFMQSEPILKSYDKNNEMSKEQKKALTRLNVKFNYRLKLIANDLKINNFTSHSARYTYANISIALPNADIYATMGALGHQNVQTTVIYKNKQEKNKNIDRIASEINNLFIL